MATTMQQLKKFVTRFNELSKWRKLPFVSNFSRTVHNSINESNKNSTLYRQLYARIMSCGPITVADYMKEVLTHPAAGYYMTKDVFGRKGDFVTSPEISQLFGEMIAVWIINEWNKITGNSFQLVELGPGKGTLMNDILRIFKRLGLLHMVSVHLVEISPFLSSIQAERLCNETKEISSEANDKDRKDSVTYYRRGITKDGVEIFWYYSILDIPKKFSVFLAHEFFDALPIHIFQRINREWKEVLIDVSEDVQEEEKFRYVLSPFSTPACVYISKDEQRDHVELSPQTMVIAEYMSNFLYKNGGFALIADYGHSGEKTDTFRAFKKHKLHDPLLEPGSADLTADVDFSVIKAIAAKDERLITFGPLNQGEFLLNLGIEFRLKQLLKKATDEQKVHLQTGYDMITKPDKMGERFKILTMFPFVLKKHLEQWPVAGF